jgi:hypothetical protein
MIFTVKENKGLWSREEVPEEQAAKGRILLEGFKKENFLMNKMIMKEIEGNRMKIGSEKIQEINKEPGPSLEEDLMTTTLMKKEIIKMIQILETTLSWENMLKKLLTTIIITTITATATIDFKNNPST